MGLFSFANALFGLQWQVLVILVVAFWGTLTLSAFQSKRGARIWQGFTIFFLPSFISGIIVTIIYQNIVGSLTLASIIGGFTALVTGFTLNKVIGWGDFLNKWFAR